LQTINHFLFATLTQDSDLQVKSSPSVSDWREFEDKEERRFHDDEQLIKDDVHQYRDEWNDEKQYLMPDKD